MTANRLHDAEQSSVRTNKCKKARNWSVLASARWDVCVDVRAEHSSATRHVSVYARAELSSSRLNICTLRHDHVRH